MSQPAQQPLFHEAYAALVAGLPPPQLREAHKRLMKCKQPLTAEEIVGEHPKVLACLQKIAAAYERKKGRSATSSKARRDAVRERLVRMNAGSDADVAACCPSDCSERTGTATVDTGEETISDLQVSDLTVAMSGTAISTTEPEPTVDPLALSLTGHVADEAPVPSELQLPRPARREKSVENAPVPKALPPPPQFRRNEPLQPPLEKAKKGRGRKFFVNQT